MTPSEFLEAVREDNETALSRLGSSKSLYAATGGELDARHVLEAAADAEHVAAETFQSWADDEPHDRAQRVFADAARDERDHYEAVAAELDDYDPDETPSAMQASLRDREDTVERAGALLGRVLATEKSKEQLTAFFTGQADPQTASLFRELKADLDDQRDAALGLLETVCETDADWQTARDAADAAVQAAYDEYTEQLESMGVNPKPVC
ncbi:rubrerythrin family protein [Halobacterium yunchengense]|uniref:rubrerythrin family protein n=1 Tax=Halobacterium yunchengense TaxID=3108497 RepID=UPI0030093AA8